MDKKRIELMMKFKETDDMLEKEKGKRDLIMVALSSLCCGTLFHIIQSNNGSPSKSIVEIFGLILVSVIVGGAVYFFSVGAFVLVTQSFTNIESLRSQLKSLEDQIKEIDHSFDKDNFRRKY